MKEQIISFETAKLAKEKGFKIKEHKFFYVNPGSKIYGIDEKGRAYPTSKRANKSLYEIGFVATLNTKNVIIAPTQSLLQKWLREEHLIHITITSISQESWMFRVTLKRQTLQQGVYGEDFNNYEKALEQGLQETLKLIKKNK